jgi:methylase of polypeptide subunit release factors
VSGRLQAGGVLALEVGQGQAETAKEILDGQRTLAPAAIIQDYQRIGRVVLARRLEPNKSKTE